MFAPERAARPSNRSGASCSLVLISWKGAFERTSAGETGAHRETLESKGGIGPHSEKISGLDPASLADITQRLSC